MMKNKWLIIAIAVVAVLVVAWFAFGQSGTNNQSSSDEVMTEQENGDTMMKDEGTTDDSMMEEDKMTGDDKMMEDDQTTKDDSMEGDY